MKYEKPEWEKIEIKLLDIITQSPIDGVTNGDGENLGGNGEYPWE